MTRIRGIGNEIVDTVLDTIEEVKIRGQEVKEAVKDLLAPDWTEIHELYGVKCNGSFYIVNPKHTRTIFDEQPSIAHQVVEINIQGEARPRSGSNEEKHLKQTANSPSSSPPVESKFVRKHRRTNSEQLRSEAARKVSSFRNRSTTLGIIIILFVR
jgi:hypothetical protein